MNNAGLCHICKDVYTSNCVEVNDGANIFVCGHCVEKAKDNFIWLCLTCGKAYIKPKDLVITRVKNHEMKKAYMLCRDVLVIQGIDVCMSCSPERIFDYVEAHQELMEC